MVRYPFTEKVISCTMHLHLAHDSSFVFLLVCFCHLKEPDESLARKRWWTYLFLCVIGHIVSGL